MKQALQAASRSIRAFAKDEDGSQVVEYGLIIAVVSIGLVVALQALNSDGTFSDLITRVQDCLTKGKTCA